MFGFSNRQLLLLSLIINLILLLSTLHGSLDLTTVSKDELHSWSQLANERLDQFTQQASRHTAANVVRAPKCDMCSAAPELCKEMGKNRMAQALSYAGSNQRLRRVLKKMRSGEPWTLGVIGGSVSKGHGVAHGNDNNKPYRNLHRKPCMHRIIFDHLDTLFPSRHPQVAQSLEEAAEKKAKNPKWITPLVDIAAVEKGLEFDPAEIKEPISRAYGFSAKSLGVNSFVNGAQGATGSDYFGFCFGEHIPQDVDLVLVELGINDERQLKTLDNYEIMLRGLLDMPNKPAVLYIEVFQMMFSTMGFGADLHRGINEYYDIPSVSLRNPFLPQALAHSELVPGMFIPDKNMAGPINGVDTRHLSNDFHNITAQLVNAYIDSQLCEMDQEGDVDYEEDPIPRQTLGSQWDLDVNLPPLKPTCKSLASVKNKLTPITNEGWEEWAWKEKKYIIAKKPGSKITFPVSTTLGTVQLIYQRAYAYGLGKVRCGLVGVASTDTVLDGYWSLPYNILQTHTMRNIPPGDYTMKCELLPQTSDPDGGTEFRIASITSI